jgi:hypothetical protein
MWSRNSNKFCEATRVEVSLLELRTHRNVPTATIMTAETRNVVGHGYSIADLEFAHITPGLDHLTGNLVTQDHGLVQLLKPDLVNIRETNPAGRDLK